MPNLAEMCLMKSYWRTKSENQQGGLKIPRFQVGVKQAILIRRTLFSYVLQKLYFLVEFCSFLTSISLSFLRKNTFSCLFIVHSIIILSRHEQACFKRIYFERYLSHYWAIQGYYYDETVLAKMRKLEKTMIKDILYPLQLFVEKYQFSNQNYQWLNNIIYHEIANLMMFWMA